MSKHFKALGRVLRPGDLGKLMQRFEEAKRNFDFTKGEPLSLSTDDGVTHLFSPSDVEAIFEQSHREAIRIIVETTEYHIDTGRDICAVFLGGSFLNPGLYTLVKRKMETLKQKAAAKGVKLHYVFMGEYESVWYDQRSCPLRPTCFIDRVV